MNNPNFSFIILTLNEEQHLPRLLHSIAALEAAIYVLDSGSTDETLNICRKHNIQVKYQSFKNHPKQWDTALKVFEIQTPWVIGLDADQIVTTELCKQLENFKNEDYNNIDGIYFNRKNYFKGHWIKYGGYYPKYLLKMFRYNIGYSDLTENMDHRFQVPGKTLIWKNGHLIEENLRENKISFWIDKHNRYSDLLAEEEILRIKKSGNQTISPKLWGSPNEHNAWLKRLWRQMPKYLRPFIYFLCRIIFQLGILDGRTGIIYHFLQAFWFRLIVDIKIDEYAKPSPSSTHFLITFLILFCLFYSFNLIYIGITSPGGIYISFLDQHLNYISYWRHFCISTTGKLLTSMGYQVSTNRTGLNVGGHAGFKLIYSCLGYGIMSCFAAFVIAFPKSLRSKLIFLTAGLTGIQLLNTLRFMMISIYYHPTTSILNIDHHDIFNYLLYAVLSLITYLWINYIPANSKKTLIKSDLK